MLRNVALVRLALIAGRQYQVGCLWLSEVKVVKCVKNIITRLVI